MSSKKSQKKSRKFRILVVLVLLARIRIAFRGAYNAAIVYSEPTTLQIQKGETLSKFTAHLSSFQKMMMKLWLKNNKNLIPNLQEGSYLLSGVYTKAELMQLIKQGPQKNFTRATLLEGWSIYDIDQYLTQQGLLSAGQFIQKANDQQFIQGLKSEFSFLSLLPAGKSLEGFLYPDTYFLDQNSNIAEQLIKAQLKNFNQKIWIPFGEKLQSFRANIQLSAYDLLTLASIIENEEKTAENKPIIASIFLNRLTRGMRLDADVSLCYGLQITYDQCRNQILPHLYDASNPYNTRQNTGLTPTPISSPSVETVSALLNFKTTNALFYLHDAQGEIHYGTTLEEHNANKEKYL